MKPFCNFGAKRLKPSLDNPHSDKRRIGAPVGAHNKGASDGFDIFR
jgi:hypothetical protein